MFLRGGRVDTRMYTMVLKKLIGFFQKIVHEKAVRSLRIIFLEMVVRQKYTNKLGSAEQIQEIRKWETNLEAKTLSNIVKKNLDVLSSLIVKYITINHMPNGTR